MVAYVVVHFSIPMPAQNEHNRRDYRKYGNRKKRVPYLADDVLIVGVFLLYLIFKEGAFPPNIKQQEHRCSKQQVADSYTLDVAHKMTPQLLQGNCIQ